MSVEISLSSLAKSQLLTLKGEIVTDFSPAGGTDISGAASLHQGQSIIRLQNVVIDNKYKILNLLGEGGMGAVYKAHHLMLNKDVALKTFLSPNLTGDSWQRFQREAKAIASLSHNNIVQVFDFGVGENNVPYYTMEYLRGESLAERLKRNGPLPVDQAIKIFLQVCQAMAAAHNKGIIHRDLKPANIFLAVEEGTTSKSELVKVVDFGIASLAGESNENQKLTRAGTVFGSPLYMSPEQSLGAETTVGSDVYSCACALFETLTGSPPFRGNSALETMIQHQQMAVPRLSDAAPSAEYPQRLNALLAQMMEKDPQKRLQTMTEVSTQLQEIASRYDAADRDRGQTRQQAGGADGPTASINAASTGLKLSVLALLAVILIGGGLAFYCCQPKSIVPSQTPVASTKSAANSKPTARTKGAKDENSNFPFTALPLNPLRNTIRENVAVNEEKAPPVLTVKKYLQNPPADRFAIRRFFFPGKVSFGLLIWSRAGEAVPPYPPPGKKEALNNVIVPAKCDLSLIAGAGLSQNPRALSGFGANDLLDLSFDGKDDWSDEHISYVGNLTGLIKLDIAEINITDKCLQYIQKLPNLKQLTVKKTYLTGTALSGLKVLPRLSLINGSGIHSFRKVLEKLAHSTELSVLIVDDCDLNDEDMKLVSTMPCINYLDLSYNKISEKGLAEICKLTKLNKLVLHGSTIAPSSLPILKKLPMLRHLCLPECSTADQTMLRRIFPQVDLKFDRKHGIVNGQLEDGAVNNER